MLRCGDRDDTMTTALTAFINSCGFVCSLQAQVQLRSHFARADLLEAALSVTSQGRLAMPPLSNFVKKVRACLPGRGQRRKKADADKFSRVTPVSEAREGEGAFGRFTQTLRAPASAYLGRALPEARRENDAIAGGSSFRESDEVAASGSNAGPGQQTSVKDMCE